MASVAGATCSTRSSATTPTSAAATSSATASRSSCAARRSFTTLEDIAEPSSRRRRRHAGLVASAWRASSSAPAFRYGVVTRDGKGEIVTGTVMMLIGQNSREVVHARQGQASTSIQAELPAGVRIEPYYDRADFIDRTLHTVAEEPDRGRAARRPRALRRARHVARQRCSWRSPFRCRWCVAVIGMMLVGVTGNLMSLGAIDFGLLVDGAIVMVEAAMARSSDDEPSRADIPDVVRRSDGAARPSRYASPSPSSCSSTCRCWRSKAPRARMFRPMAITVALALARRARLHADDVPRGLRVPLARAEASRRAGAVRAAGGALPQLARARDGAAAAARRRRRRHPAS